MLALTAYDQQNIALFGLGGSGLSTAKALAKGGARVTCWDDSEDVCKSAAQQGLTVKDLHLIDFTRIDCLVLSPGVPFTHPKPHWSVVLAKSAGIPVIGDIELFDQQRRLSAPDSTLIAITGTNGKSTTTALIAHLLSNAGLPVEMGGNIGRAVCDFDRLDNETYFVVECSSYQIDLAPNLKPNIGVLLNLTPDHLDRHGTMEHYAEVKSRLVKNSDAAIVGVDDQYCRAIAEALPQGREKLIPITVENQLDHGGYTENNHACLRVCETSHPCIDLTGNYALRGKHNGQNTCAALASCVLAGVAPEQFIGGFANFGGLIDRMQPLEKIGNVLVVNDSKGTNADATAFALDSFDTIYWIAGGLAKEGGIQSLSGYFNKIVKAYLIGEAAPSFAQTLEGQVPFEMSGTLETAFHHALNDADIGGEKAPVILLSPACASFDQFPSYAERGRVFRDLVNQARHKYQEAVS